MGDKSSKQEDKELAASSEEEYSEIIESTGGRIDAWRVQAIHIRRTVAFGIRVEEEPLTPSTLIFVLSVIGDLVTKCRLIGHGRFADLIEYTQTHDGRFAREAHFVFTAMTYNSPWEGSFKFDVTASNVAEGIVTAIDGVSQMRQRIEKVELENEKAELENRKLAEELEQARQKAKDGKEKAQFEAQFERERQAIALEKERLALEQERLAFFEKRLDVQKKGIGYAFEIAAQTVQVLQPGADEQTKGILIQALLPTILQLQSGKEVTLVFPMLPSSAEKDKGEEDKDKKEK